MTSPLNSTKYTIPFTTWIDLLDDLLSRRGATSVLDYPYDYERSYRLGDSVRMAYLNVAQYRVRRPRQSNVCLIRSSK